MACMRLRPLPWWTCVGLAIALGAVSLSGFDRAGRAAFGGDEPDAPAEKGTPLSKKWTILHRPQAKALPKDSPLEALEDFEFSGPRPGDPFLLGEVKVERGWQVFRGVLQPAGKNTAVRLGRGENFDLEGQITADGLGGWFLLFGWDQGHGYALYNVTLKESGSPWLVCEFRDSKGIEDTHREIYRYLWKGAQTFRLSVEDGKVNLLVGKDQIADDLALPNYHEGDIILGTYDTRYGPKHVKVHSLRIRAR